jgi:hypothetical protein
VVEDDAVTVGVFGVAALKEAETTWVVAGFFSRISGSGWSPLVSKAPVRIS